MQGKGRGLHWVFIVACRLSLVVAQVLNCLVAHDILVPQAGIQPSSPALEGRFLTLEHWEVPKIFFLFVFYVSYCIILSVYFFLCSSCCNSITEMILLFYFKFFLKSCLIKVRKENNLQPRLLYPARISFKYEGEIKSFTDKQKLREFSTTKPALQQMLKDLL